MLSTEYYDRTSEQQEALGFLAQSTSSTEPSEAIPEARAAASDHKRVKYAPAGTTRLPHGSVGAIAAHQAIAHGNSPEIAEALFKYSAPEEVSIVSLHLIISHCVDLILLVIPQRFACSETLHLDTYEPNESVCCYFQVMTFPSTCGACGVKAETRMFVTSIHTLCIFLFLNFA